MSQYQMKTVWFSLGGFPPLVDDGRPPPPIFCCCLFVCVSVCVLLFLRQACSQQGLQLHNKEMEVSLSRDKGFVAASLKCKSRPMCVLMFLPHSCCKKKKKKSFVCRSVHLLKLTSAIWVGLTVQSILCRRIGTCFIFQQPRSDACFLNFSQSFRPFLVWEV